MDANKVSPFGSRNFSTISERGLLNDDSFIMIPNEIEIKPSVDPFIIRK